MNHEINEVRVFHETFCRETGVSLRLGLGEYFREQAWARFIKLGFKVEDLQLVCRYLKSQILQAKRNAGALRFSNLIERPEMFEEELQLARGAQRQKPKPTALGRAMQQLRPTVTPVTPHETRVTAVPVSELIANLKRAAGMSVTP